MLKEQSNFDTLSVNCYKLSCIDRREHDACLVQTRMRQLTYNKNSKREEHKLQEQKKFETSDKILLRKLNCKLSSFISRLRRAKSNLAQLNKSKPGQLQDVIKRVNTV